MPKDVAITDAKAENNETVRIRDLTKDQLCDILVSNQKTLNSLVARYNACVSEKHRLEEENAQLQNEILDLNIRVEKAEDRDTLNAILASVSRNDLEIRVRRIEPGTC